MPLPALRRRAPCVLRSRDAPHRLRGSVRRIAGLAAALAVLALAWPAGSAADTLRIGSKRFTESYILAEVLAQTARPYAPVELRQGLGNTAIVYEALRAGSIDVYPEYTGTIAQEILKAGSEPLSLEAMRERLQPLGLGVDVPLGFNNGYALAMREDRASGLAIARLSDLASHPTLRPGLTSEFIGRADGWPGLAKRYDLPQRPVGLEHGLAYDALVGGQVDLIDIYTTDARIGQLKLRVLEDDLGHFPRYDAVLLYRLDVPRRFPAAWAALQRLRGTISEPQMIAMNARAELDSVPFDAVARDHLSGGATGAKGRDGFLAKLFGADLGRLTAQHLALVAISVLAATVVGVPLATLATPYASARTLVLGASGLLQTVPSLAMLALLISWVGAIGVVPALIALTLYALLPIMRNTVTGLAGVPPGLRMAALALGLTPLQRLRHIDLPLALPTLLAGVRTATTIAVGTATIAAFIGAGGYGERIVTGLALNDRELLVAGALPAAALALAAEGLFGAAAWLLDRRRYGPG